MRLEVQEKRSLTAADHGGTDNNIGAQEASMVDDVCDWGFLFADDDDVVMEISGEEFRYDHQPTMVA